MDRHQSLFVASWILIHHSINKGSSEADVPNTNNNGFDETSDKHGHNDATLFVNACLQILLVQKSC